MAQHRAQRADWAMVPISDTEPHTEPGPDDDSAAPGRGRSGSDVSTFDFAGSGRLTRERSRVIRSALDEVAREATEALRLWVDGVRVEACDVEQRTVGDLLAGVVDHTVLSLPERAERGLLITELGLARSLVLSLMGGTPRDDGPPRPLTPIELEVLDLVLVRLLGCVGAVLGLGPIEMGVHETDPAAATSFDERELMLGVPFALSNDHFSGRVWVVLNPAALQPITAEYEQRHAALPMPGRPGDRHRTRALLEGVTVPVVCGFPPVRVPARELAHLQPGEVLRLGQAVSRDLVLTVGGSPLLAVRAGQRGHRLVAEVLRTLAPLDQRSLPGGSA